MRYSKKVNRIISAVFLLRSLKFLIILTCIFVCLIACTEEEVQKSNIEFDYQQHDKNGQLHVMESNGELSSFHPTLQNGATGVQYEIKLLLDRPVAETTVIRYSIAGTATRSENSELADFEIEPQGNLITINKGEQEASLLIRIFEDYELEYFELNNIAYLVEGITITLDEVVSGSGVLGADKTFSVFISEDDTLVFLSWDPLDEGGADPGDVDMDLFVWLNGEVINASTQKGIAFEGLSYPAGFPDGQYGFSYTYYSGSSNNLEFYVEILNPGGMIDIFHNSKSFIGKYNFNNKNNYEVSGIVPYIAQTMDKVGLNYFNLTGITVNEFGSRIKKEIWTKESISKFPIKRLDPKLPDILRKTPN